MRTAMLEGGADVRFIQAMLGHVRLDTTAIYTRVSTKKLQEIHAATHPGALLRRRERRTPEDDEDLSSLVAQEQSDDERDA